MWKRKTEDQIDAERRDMRPELIESAFTALCFTALWWHQVHAPSWWGALGVCLLTFIIALGLLGLTGGNVLLSFPAFVPSGSSSSADICVACFTVQNTAPCCTQCGGGLEPLAQWTWKDGPPSQDGTSPLAAETKA